MSLLDMANTTLDNFDPKKDSINGPSGLPAGEYQTVITTVAHSASKSGWDYLALAFQVVGGEHAGETENNNISFAEKTKNGKDIPEFILKRNMRFVTKLGALVGVKIDAADFAGTETDVHETLANKLVKGKGSMVQLTVIESKNKKDPANPYISYDLGEALSGKDDPFAGKQADPSTPTDDDEPPF